MAMLLTIVAVGLVAASVVFVLGCHWDEFHGSNHY